MKRAIVLLVLLPAGCASRGRPEPSPETARAIARGVEHLRGTQNPDGSWGTGRGTTGFDVRASVPGAHDAFRVGSTALCVLALREAGEREASRRGLEYLVAYDGARRPTRAEIYNVWAHTYALKALARAWAEEGVEAYRDAALRQLRHLERYEAYTGGWNYYDFVIGARTPSMEATSFGTAAGLEALHEAKRAGIPVPEGLLKRALQRLQEMRLPDGSFLYAANFRYRPAHFANRNKGSLGRTQSCHFALMLWETGGIDREKALAGLDVLFREHRFLDIGRKRQFPHESWYATSGYYYYYGHYYAARLIELLGAEKEYAGKLRACVLPHQEPDGSWWDYKMYDYHKPYGTAFALMTLLRCG